MSQDHPRHPSGSSSDISSSGSDSDYAPAAHAPAAHAPATHASAAHASAAHTPAAERRLALPTSRTPQTPASVSSHDPSSRRKSSREGRSTDLGRPTKKIRAEMKLGFDVVASQLREMLNQQVGNLEISAGRSVAVANSQLKTTFHSSAKWTATPRPVSGSVRNRRSLSPVPPRPSGSANLATITPPSSAGRPDAAVTRLDAVTDDRSSQNQGMKRLKIEEMVCLLVGDELVIVVPPHAD